MAWQNADGLQVRFGSDWKEAALRTNRPGTLSTAGAVKQLEIDVDLKQIPAGGVLYTADLNNDGTRDGFYSGDVRLPAHSSVLRATLIMGEAAAGGTSITVGTYLASGSAVAATGLITATEGVLANMNAAGKRVYGAGSLVSATAGTGGVGAADVYIGIGATGTFTAGKGRLVIEYVDPLPLPQSGL